MMIRRIAAALVAICVVSTGLLATLDTTPARAASSKESKIKACRFACGHLYRQCLSQRTHVTCGSSRNRCEYRCR
jgi:hypothetical protein